MKTKNILVLGSCAGLFHWSNNNYTFGTKEYREYKTKLYNALRNLHGGDEVSKENRTFEYVLNENGTPVINYNGFELVCNDKMIESISGDFERCDIINNRFFADFSKFDTDKWRIMLWKDNDAHLYNNTFASLSIDMFSNGLKYYRIYFKHDKVEFICSNGKLYLVADAYKETSIKEICNRLGIESAKAKKEIQSFFDYILK